MKWVYLSVALLCWSLRRHVWCSEQSSPGSGLAARDGGPQTAVEARAHEKVEEERAALLLSSVGAEMEEQPSADVPDESRHAQTVNVVEELLESIHTESGQPVSEPEPHPDPEQLALDPAQTQAPPLLQTEAEILQAMPSLDKVESAALTAPSTELRDEPQSDPNVDATVMAEPDSAPDSAPHPAPGPASATSDTATDGPSSALEIASPGAPLKNSSASQCELGSVALSSQALAPGAALSSVEVEPVDTQVTGTSADLITSPDSPELDLMELEQTVNTSHPTEDQQAADSEAGTDPPVPSKEDIPTFDEWKKKVMEVEEKKSQSLHSSSNGSPQPGKKIQKNFKNNYASVECGAKILAANNEAKSTPAILMENMDLYMLNPCSNKIWFVIELCEPIQVKQLDIANFELFSSTPKDFLVSISDRYPTSKWIKLGTFHARDERTVQSFPLDEQLYAKYVKMFIKYMKVELLSHFGSEHFCPLSLIRVFGTSMVEEYDEIADSQYPSERVEYLDEDYDYPRGYLPTEDKPSKNLLGSATNAILTMVNNIAANVLGGKPELEDGAQMNGNMSSGTENGTGLSTETIFTPTPTPTEQQAIMHTSELDPTLVKPDPEVPISESPSAPAPEENRVVILIEEEEEPATPTVTLLEGDDEEDRRREEAWKREHGVYCGHLSTLSCLASLHEHLHLYCSAALALQRDRQSHGHTCTRLQTPLHRPYPVPTPTQTPSPPSENLPEEEEPAQPQDEGLSPTDLTPAPARPVESGAEPVPDTVVLEPSHTSPLPPPSFSDISTPTPVVDIPETLPTGEPQNGQAPYLEHVHEMATTPHGSISDCLSPTPTASVLVPTSELPEPETNPPMSEPPAPTIEQPLQPLPTHTQPTDIPPPTELPMPSPEASEPDRATGPEDLQQMVDSSQEEPVEDLLLSVAAGQGGQQRAATDFYAELQNASEPSHGNGNQVHGSNQKESVFMRLNNRIKALEMNMSLSSRYLEELSQRYRKQMEEMQRAFNKTIIKLQNTSRIAEEQDQKQTESIQMLQSQLENITKLMLNLSATVSQLQKEVSDRQSYLVVSLLLCLLLGLVLCVQCCRGSPSHSQSTAVPVSNHYPSPKRCFSSYDDTRLKRRVSCPLVHATSFQLPTSEVGPDDLYIVEPLRFSPEKKKKRCKMKGVEKAENPRAAGASVTVTKGGLKSNGLHADHFLPSARDRNVSACSSRGGMSEGGSEGSSSSSSSSTSSTASDESCCSASSAAGHESVGSQPLQPTTNRTEKRSLKRRRSKMTEQGPGPPQPHGRCRMGLLRSPIPVTTAVMPALQLMKGKQDLGVGTFGVAAVTGRV
ncbi:SUN domain-containing ossification factor isoform X1 [Electrophorus electricus]|uniref:SUN domain-containing ossification factor isoform X1 n=1 Tax=Electrophorus electricus TaxID=8005 RepID=UPI0015CFB434|nr:SUN domain-containing ossification factor isoform X1 [Electrophorus electricus]